MASPAGLGTSFVVLVNSILALVVLLDIAELTGDQIAGINLVVVNIVAFAAGAWTYMHSTPVANPTLPQGTVVNVTTPPGEANREVTV